MGNNLTKFNRDVLRIVKEDILRTISEEKNKKISIKFIKSEIKVSNFFASQAINELKKDNLIQIERRFIGLTELGRKEAEDILKKHLVLENYFKKTRNQEEAHQAAHILEHYISEEVIDNIKKLSTLARESMPLTGLELNTKSMIGDIVFSDYELLERIVSMGIFPGEEIKITNKIPHTFIINIRNKKFALSESIAKGIKVIPRYF